ncbi:hypothetical protein ES704_01791 [subsurface metagenome]|jgi:hypothetical protein
MSKIKWDKTDVIRKFQEAMSPEQSKTGQRSNVLKTLLDKAKLRGAKGTAR